MVEVQRSTRATDGDPDVSLVVRVLHDAGPLGLRELDEAPELAGWSPGRVEDAVVSAWSRGLIFIDTHDMVVAL